MKYLLDTNILLRLIELAHSQHRETIEALKKLRRRNCTFYILLQNVSEFWNVGTRPTDKNGLGLSIARADSHLSRFERLFTILPDTKDVYKNWRELVVNHSVSGVKVHDAKIVAAMKAHNIQNLLTFNVKDFRRYTEIKAIEPKDV
ncbi:MAG: type II toxin-antitoxin system VapC family toxin [Pyrinomonadaceae bacterium]|nr:type II toxin-antitoxin system VapC family toxin [Pyrinomonadaceae bacterium]